MISKIIILSFLIIIIQSPMYIEPQPNVQKVQIRIGEAAQLKYPTFSFQNIYQKWVVKVQNGIQEEDDYQYCYQQDSSINFYKKTFLKFGFKKQTKDVIYDFEDIKYRQGVIDVTIIGNSIYTVFQNANLTIVTFDQKGTLQLTKLITFPNVTRLSYGRFVQLNNNNLLFVSLDNAFVIGQNINLANGYQVPKILQNAIGLMQNYFAIGEGIYGVSIHKYNDGKIQFVTQYNSSFFNRSQIDVSDLAYNTTTSTLYILNQLAGVILMNISINQEKLKQKIHHTTYLKTGCQNILLFNQSIYLACQKLYKIGSRVEVTLPDPLFKVKQMYAFGRFFIVFGQNIFKIYFDQRLIDYGQFDLMDQFILSKQFYIGVNQNGINYGTYDFQFPKITCTIPNSFQQGSVNLVLKTQAECNMDYFKYYQINITKSQIDDFQTCIYTVPIQLTFWKATDINIKLIVGVISVLVVIIISLLIWATLVKRGHSNLQQTLARYQSLIGQNKDYDVMVQQKKDQQHKEGEDIKTGTMQIQVKHDIGQ